MHRGTPSLLRVRALCVLVAVAALWAVLHRAGSGGLMEALRHARWEWAMAAVVLFGLLFVPAAARWRLALRMTGHKITRMGSMRLAFIGHFFYAIFFGAAGGDVAKSAFFARRRNVPLPDVLVVSSLDRLLGFCGLILFALSAVCAALANGGLNRDVPVGWRHPGVGWLAVLAVGAALIYWLRPKKEAARFKTTFLSASRRLLESPRTLMKGVVCGFLVQLALSGVLALNLQAVSHTPVPWLQLAWTFPLITIISALPVTVAGLGVRDGAALVLFGWCGVAAGDAIAASLLTAAVNLVWAAGGGVVLWRETARNGEPEYEAPALVKR